jgi:uncharacterized membrane protein YedE/YeeE
MNEFTPVAGAVGGALIGLAAAVLLALNGRLAGISGIVDGLLPPRKGETAWRVLFVTGLILGAGGWNAVSGDAAGYRIDASVPWLVAGGLLVGFGARLGPGCTSGHGICGLARLSRRSLVAVCVFMLTAIVTVYVTRHVLGGVA